ncbi:MAG: hypothetical protein LBR97_10680 [Dysgonamonadaceae bacterium]|jgi:hypothetical protein|nr:hypothetical protein [Dysgonamonadaceae bacterium]
MAARFKTYLFYACAVLLVVSAALYITDNKYVPYVYAVSGAGIAVAYLTNPYRGDNLRLKRLNIQQTIAAILLPVSSYLMFQKRNEWFATLFVSAILQLYVAIIRKREEK